MNCITVCGSSQDDTAGVSNNEEDRPDPPESNVPHQVLEEKATECDGRTYTSTDCKNTNDDEVQNTSNDDLIDSKQQQVGNPSNETDFHKTTTENQKQPQDPTSEADEHQDAVKTKVRIDKASIERFLSKKEELRSRNNICTITTGSSEPVDGSKRKPSLKESIALLSAKNKSKKKVSVDHRQSNVSIPSKKKQASDPQADACFPEKKTQKESFDPQRDVLNPHNKSGNKVPFDPQSDASNPQNKKASFTTQSEVSTTQNKPKKNVSFNSEIDVCYIPRRQKKKKDTASEHLTVVSSEETTRHQRRSRKSNTKATDQNKSLVPHESFTGGLNANDLQEIGAQHWLSDKHIDAFMTKVKYDYPYFGGLQDTVLQSLRMWEKVTSEYIQVFLVNNNHWVTASTVGARADNINIYDSMMLYPSSETLDLIAHFHRSTSRQLTFNIMHVQKQENDVDCGAFALAFLSSLVFFQNPTQLSFSNLREHLAQCFTCGTISPFPSAPCHRQREVLKSITIKNPMH